MLPLNVLLERLFQAHSVETASNGEAILFPNHPTYKAWAFAEVHSQNSQVVTVRLDIVFEFAPLRGVRESFAGFGSNQDDAIKSAFENFSANSLHVMLTCFFGQSHDSVREEVWQIGQQSAKVFIGCVGMRGDVPLNSDQHLAWFQLLETSVKKLELAGGTNWVRFFLGQLQSEVIECEFLVNNHTSDELQTTMSRFSWPLVEAFYSLRLFLMMQSSGDTTVTPQQAVEFLAEAIHSKEAFGEDEAVASIMAAGIPDTMAKRAYDFTQIAWSRIFLKQLKVSFSTEYFIHDRRGDVIETGVLTDDERVPLIVESKKSAPGGG